MSRLHEDPATRRMVDTDHPAYRVGEQAARSIIDDPKEFQKVPAYLLDAELMMDDLTAEDPDVREEWGMYLVLKGMVDAFREYQRDRST
jgi:hypothetical protein